MAFDGVHELAQTDDAWQLVLSGPAGGFYTFDAKPRDIQSAVARVSYKFDWPVVARY